MTSPTPGPALPDERRGRRTHPLTGVVQGGLWAGAAVVGLGWSSLQGDGWGDVPWWVAVLVVVGGGLLAGQLAGFVSWWTTRYVVDAEELRIDSGVLTRRSRRAAFDRIQSVDVAEPALARLAGLAEVRVDLAGGEESRLVLRYLPVDEARRTRRLLLVRAHGTGDDGEGDDGAAPGVLITRVTPQRTVLGALLSLDLLASAAAVAAVLLASLGLGGPLLLLGGVVPALTYAVRVVGRRVVGEWGFVLWRTPHGLRIERGLLSLTSQTIPYARVQGVAVVEPILWRRLGWCRLEVDVAGGSTGGDEEDRETTLLPIADRALAAALLAELVPEDDDARVHRVAASPRSWPFAPVGWRTRWIALGPRRATSATGWLHRRTSSAPHAKVQSIAVRQGPVQRRLGLATVELHTPDGPLDVDAHHLEAEHARATALEALARGRGLRGSAAAGGVLGPGVDGPGDLA